MSVARRPPDDLPTRAWAGRPAPLDEVERELRLAWHDGLTAAGSGEAGPLAVRASVLNLTVVTPTLAAAEHVSALLERLGARHPSRTIIVVPRSDDPGATFQASVRSNLYPLPGTGRQLIFEQITIVAGQQAILGIPAVVDRLLNSELPNFLWWIGEPRFAEAPFTKMMGIADRLIVDSTCFANLAESWRHLAEIVARESGAGVSDCAWSELRPWRELVAQFFDPPGHRPCLGSLASVDVVYSPERVAGRSARARALLIIGWLGARLGWRVSGELLVGVGRRAWRVVAGDRELDVSIVEEDAEDGIPGLRRVVLTANDDYPGVFRVIRESNTALSTAIDVAGTPSPVRVARAVVGDEMACAVEGLSQFGRDRVYDRAQLFATELERYAGSGRA